MRLTGQTHTDGFNMRPPPTLTPAVTELRLEVKHRVLTARPPPPPNPPPPPRSAKARASQSTAHLELAHVYSLFRLSSGQDSEACF